MREIARLSWELLSEDLNVSNCRDFNGARSRLIAARRRRTLYRTTNWGRRVYILSARCWRDTRDGIARDFGYQTCNRMVDRRIARGRSSWWWRWWSSSGSAVGRGLAGDICRLVGRRRICPGRGRTATMPGDHDLDVQGDRIQPHVHAEPVQPRQSGGSRAGGPPVLAAGRDPVFQRSPVSPLQHVRSHLHDQLSQTAARLSVRLRTG